MKAKLQKSIMLQSVIDRTAGLKRGEIAKNFIEGRVMRIRKEKSTRYFAAIKAETEGKKWKKTDRWRDDWF